MQKLADICIRRPVFASMLIASLVVVGIAGYLNLGVDRFPAVDLPTVRVSTRLPGASPAEMESQITQPIEEAVNTVEGIKELTSVSSSGNSFVIATFELDRDIEAAAQDVRDRVARVVRDLPRDADPPVVSKSDTDLSPVLSLALTGDRSARELTELAEKIVKVQLERSAGVGEVDVLGGLSRSINVWVDADRLAAYGLPITAVRAAIERQNANIPGGNVTDPLRERPLRTLGRLTNAAAFADLVVATRDGSPIRVRDLGWAEDGTKEARTLSRLNGVPTVSLDIRRQSGANTVAVIDGVKARLAAVQAQLPADVRIEVLRDQSRYIHEALREINLHLILGSILACLVVLVFMRNGQATLIAAVAIPTSVIATFAVMKAFGFTLNSVTMLALVLMVGIVIDDAIVVLENIHRFIEEKGLSPFEAARQGTAEIALAVMATTLSLVVIFVPVSFMSSISGRFLFQFGLTAPAAILGMLDRNPGRSLSQLKDALPQAWTSLTMSPHCADEAKYGVVEGIVAEYEALGRSGGRILGRAITDVITVNGVRVALEDGSWVLVRASSNKPEVVVVVESTRSEDDMRALFREEVKPRLARRPEIGAYNQEI